MKKLSLLMIITVAVSTVRAQSSNDGWISLFDGKSFNGWHVGNNASTFTIENGSIVAHGPTAHLFYEGSVMNHEFKDFEFKAQVMTTPGSNSGIYFHAAYQESGFPNTGIEVQVNQSHTDWRRTGSVYGIKDIPDSVAKDNEWYTEYIMVKGKTVTVKVNGKVVNEYTQPEDFQRKGRMISAGTFALQGHDPKSIVYFKDIMVRPL